MIEINQYIDPVYKSAEFLHTKSFGDLGLEDLKGTQYYYEKLYQEKQQNPQGKLAQYCEGNTPSDGGTDYENGLANHEEWKEFENMTDSEKKLVQKQVEYQLKDTANALKGRGHTPGELSNILDKILNPEQPKFNWKSYLRRFMGGSNKVYTKKSRRKQSKRYEDNPGIKVKQKRQILIFNDSSGSVSDKDYLEFMNEIHHISKTDTAIYFADFDTVVHEPRKYTGRDSIKRSGYGGTDFEPCMEYFNKNKNKYCSCIVFTDGYCSAPTIKPQGKVLWAICSNGTDDIDLPGLKIKLN